MILRSSSDTPTTSNDNISPCESTGDNIGSYTVSRNTRHLGRKNRNECCWISASDLPASTSSSNNGSSSCSSSNITTWRRGRSLELTDRQLDTRPQSASTMVSTTTTTTMMYSFFMDLSDLVQYKFCDQRSTPTDNTCSAEHHPSYQSDRRRRSDNDYPDHDHTESVVRRQRQCAADHHDDDSYDYPTGLSTDSGRKRKKGQQSIRRTYPTNSSVNICRKAKRSINFVLVLLSLIMTSSAAPSNHRREDYASSHPQHLLHHTQEAIPSSDSEPLSVRDGFIPFSIGNSSIAKEQSRNTFYNLIGHDAEANPPIIIADKPKKKNRKPVNKPELAWNSKLTLDYACHPYLRVQMTS